MYHAPEYLDDECRRKLDEKEDFEVIDRQPVDPRCDIWSLGILLYVLLSGEAPFNGENDDEIRQSIKKHNLRFDNPIWQHISSDAKDVIKQMLTYDYKKRPSAKELLRDKWFEDMPYKVIDPEVMKSAFSNMKQMSFTSKL